MNAIKISSIFCNLTLLTSATLLLAITVVGHDPRTLLRRERAARRRVKGLVRAAHTFDLFAIFVIGDDPRTFDDNEEVAGNAHNLFVRSPHSFYLFSMVIKNDDPGTLNAYI